LYIHDLHKEINTQIHESNANYKVYADLHKTQEFNVEDYVMVRIRPDEGIACM